MKIANLIIAVASLAATSAFACGGRCPTPETPPSSSSSSANAGAVAGAVAGAAAGVVGSGNSYNDLSNRNNVNNTVNNAVNNTVRNNQEQGQLQGQLQGQVAYGGGGGAGGAGGAGGSASSTSNSGGNTLSTGEQSNKQSVTVNGDTYEAQKRNPVSTAWAAPLTTSNGTCMGSTSVGGQGVTIGVSFGTTWTDSGCDARYDAIALKTSGANDLVVKARLCAKPEIRQAYKDAGQPCPGDAKPTADAATPRVDRVSAFFDPQ